MKSNPGTACTIYDVTGIAKEAYNITFNKKNLESAFKATEVFPLNRNIYTDEDFLPAEVLIHYSTNTPDHTIIIQIIHPTLLLLIKHSKLKKSLFILLILQ